MVYRFHIPLTNLGGLTFDPTSTSALLSLSLVSPPLFFQRPASSRGMWTPCYDFTPNRIASSEARFLLHLDPTSPTNRILTEHPLIKPLRVVVPPTPPQPGGAPSIKSPSTVPTHASAGARLFAAAHSQAIAQRRSSSPPSPTNGPLIITPAPSELLPSAPIFPSIVFGAEPPAAATAAVDGEQEDEEDFETWYRGEACVEILKMDALDDEWW